MSRDVRREWRDVLRMIEVTSFRCDGCGKSIDPDLPGDTHAHELMVALDLDDCVTMASRRDYCQKCLEPRWKAVCAAIGRDPEAPGDDWDEGRDERRDDGG